MFLRFSLTCEDDQSKRKQGIIIGAVSIMEAAVLDKAADDELRAILGWFNDHLKVPKVLDEYGNERALSWFRSDARQALAKAWDLKRLLEANGYHIEVHRSRYPGRPIYEDDDQVVALSTRKDRGPWR